MFELAMSAHGAPMAFTTDHLMFGACLSLIGESGSWEVALFGDEAACSSLARVIYAMDDNQSPLPDEIVDAMGELINMVSGALKTRFDQQEHERITIGIPNFHVSGADCEKYQTRIIPLISQQITSPQIDGELFLVWSERTPIVLLREAKACIEASDDKMSLGSGLSALHELWEIVAETTAPENANAIDSCQRMLTTIINETGGASLSYVARVIDALIEALSEDLLIPVQMPEAPAPLDDEIPDETAPQSLVTRDSETLEMIGEFIGESQERLDKCDEILVGIERGKLTQDSIAALFRDFHTIKGTASFHELVDIEQLAHSTENLLARARDGHLEFEGIAVELVLESTSLLSRLITKVRSAVDQGMSFPTSRLARELREKIAAFLRGETVDVKRSSAKCATEEFDSTIDDAPKAPLKETVKVDVEQLGELDSLISNFDVILRLLDGPKEDSIGLKEAYDTASDLKRRMESLSMRMRMVPLRSTFQKMTRMVRDLSKKTEKLAQLTLDGEDTRVERNIVEKLNGPLVHLLRNAIDHGLETSDLRRAAGKPLIGQIRLSARLRYNEVELEIADDGQGIDADRIWSKAIAQNLASADVRPSDAELFGLIFEAGFSTAAKVTAISGRGVGMDVVRREIEALNARIEIESLKGKGTTFRIVIPHSP
jgi:signal transduction histidine kinase/chemotaxis protein CheY-P-specific phosphatase CheC